MLDTTDEAAAVQAHALRRLSPEARVALALEASDWLRRLARARLTDGSAMAGPDSSVRPPARVSDDRP